MTILLTIIAWASFIALILGLIKPSWVKMKTRGQTAKIFLSAWIITFVLFGISSAATPHGFWAFLSIVGLLALIAGLIKPSWLRLPSRKKVAYYYGLGFIIVFMIGVAVTAGSSSSINWNQLTQQSQTTQSSQTTAPQTSEQKLQAAVESALPPSWAIGGISLASSTFYYGQTLPTGTQYVEVDITVGDFWDDTSLITETGQLSAKVFQQAFQADPTFYDVSIKYDGPTTDQYGNTTTSEMFYYEMDRPLYSEINWSGLSAVQNDVHMCAFLREQRVETDAVDNGRGIECGVVQYDLQQAENTIEAQNAVQYRAIQQDGN